MTSTASSGAYGSASSSARSEIAWRLAGGHTAKWHAIADGSAHSHVSNALCGVQPSGNVTLTDAPESDLGPYADVPYSSPGPASPCAICMRAVAKLDAPIADEAPVAPVASNVVPLFAGEQAEAVAWRARASETRARLTERIARREVAAMDALVSEATAVEAAREQDLINDLATAARRVFVETTCARGFVLALAANGFDATADRLRPYAEALTEAHRRAETVAKALGWTGSARAAVLSDHRCTERCTHAKSKKCACVCGGIMHGSLLIARGPSSTAAPAPIAKRARAAKAPAHSESPAVPELTRSALYGSAEDCTSPHEVAVVIRDAALAVLATERRETPLPALAMTRCTPSYLAKRFGARKPELESIEVESVHDDGCTITAIVANIDGDLTAIFIATDLQAAA